MRKSRFTEEQIIAVLKAAEAGQKVADLCRKHGITEQTFYRWRSKYGGLDVARRDLEISLAGITCGTVVCRG